ncbi:MAG: hypothetical protein IJ087_01940 [Eggerthellaceae bacterium]|nr:hypothetical protein [Eggerthellaceae bacterium]
MNKREPVKRAVKEATTENVREALASDALGRWRDIEEFVGILDSIEGNYSIFLDAAWGTGKTFFIKEVEMVLDDKRYQMSNMKEPEIELVKSLELENRHLPIYFNAWDNDYVDEPVLSLMQMIVSSFYELLGFENIEKDANKIVEGLSEAVSVNLGLVEVNAGNLIRNLKPEDLTGKIRRDKAVRDRLHDLFGIVLRSRADRLVLFVDELDRCRPSYAIRLLEALKFLFDDDSLSIVFSVDVRMLAEAVKGCYGVGFDGERYLSRFYDRKLVLSEARSRMANLITNGEVGRKPKLRKVAEELVSRGSMSLRDQLKFCNIIDSFSSMGAANEGVANTEAIFVRNVLGPVMLECSITNPELLREFLAGEYDARSRFWDEYADCGTLVEIIKEIGQRADDPNHDSRGSAKATFESTLCYLLFDREGLEDVYKGDLYAPLNCAFVETLHVLHLG